MPHDRALQVRSRPRARLAVWTVVAALVAGVLWWYVSHPADLPTSDVTVAGATPVDQPVHLGMFTAPADQDRTLRLSGVRVRATADMPVEIVPLVCRGGSLRVTTDPDAFCRELLDPEGTDLSAGEAVVLRVVSPDPGHVSIDRVRLGFREGIQWGTQEAGNRAEVTVLGR